MWDAFGGDGVTVVIGNGLVDGCLAVGIGIGLVIDV